MPRQHRTEEPAASALAFERGLDRFADLQQQDLLGRHPLATEGYFPEGAFDPNSPRAVKKEVPSREDRGRIRIIGVHPGAAQAGERRPHRAERSLPKLMLGSVARIALPRLAALPAGAHEEHARPWAGDLLRKSKECGSRATREWSTTRGTRLRPYPSRRERRSAASEPSTTTRDEPTMSWKPELEAGLASLRSPLLTAEAFGIKELIDPRDTRPLLVERARRGSELLPSRLGPRGRSARPQASRRHAASANLRVVQMTFVRHGTFIFSPLA